MDLENMPRGSTLHDFIEAGMPERLPMTSKALSDLIFAVASAWGTRTRLVALESLQEGNIRQRLHDEIDAALDAVRIPK